jgi:hypothetical protein
MRKHWMLGSVARRFPDDGSAVRWRRRNRAAACGTTIGSRSGVTPGHVQRRRDPHLACQWVQSERSRSGAPDDVLAKDRRRGLDLPIQGIEGNSKPLQPRGRAGVVQGWFLAGSFGYAVGSIPSQRPEAPTLAKPVWPGFAPLHEIPRSHMVCVSPEASTQGGIPMLASLRRKYDRTRTWSSTLGLGTIGQRSRGVAYAANTDATSSGHSFDGTGQAGRHRDMAPSTPG